MKCYAVQLPNGEYLADVKSQPISWRGASAKTTTDITKAKHYKTATIAKSTLKRQATERRNNAKRNREQHEQRTQQQQSQPTPQPQGNGNVIMKKLVNHFNRQANYDYLLRNAENYEASADLSDTMTVIEVDVKTPTYVKKAQPDVKFETDKWKVGVTVEKSQGNCYCKVCGLYFKGIPHLALKGGYRGGKARICPWCMLEKHHEAQKIIDELEPERREEIEAERFIHRMG